MGGLVNLQNQVVLTPGSGNVHLNNVQTSTTVTSPYGGGQAAAIEGRPVHTLAELYLL
eukprot:CAMPEP_0170482704 /NCGR_PEP_ID=MMETSP0208-20121228/2604_1 /TAXON_ID=197538 /ORGANISM="Strombidium inclinatum, Strain S3" /LENGTH=57 /DNA_ID=CAMNT_0010755567 /DNA_START=128 /DNA_END=301 /DNA_ORIENTATION=+